MVHPIAMFPAQVRKRRESGRMGIPFRETHP
jgi:hypothetical protein